jgi:NitT/TauT family transport system substrate-binding protein
VNRARLTILLALGVALVGCGPAGGTSSPAASAQPTEVRISLIPGTTNAALFFGIEKGYFTRRGITVTTVVIPTGSTVIPPLLSGDLDIGQGGPNSGLFNTFLQNPGAIKIIGSVYVAAPGPSGHNQGVFVRKDVYDSGFKTARDAKGRSIYLIARGQNMEYFTQRWLDQEKTGYKASDRGGDVTFGLLPNVQQIFNSLQSKQIEAGLLIQPQSDLVVRQGIAQPLFWLNEVAPNFVTNVWMASNQFLTKNRKAAVQFMRAYMEAVQDWNVAFAKGPESADYKELVDITAKWLKQDAKNIALFPGVSASFRTADLEEMAKYYRDRGYYSAIPKVADYVDSSIAKDAGVK